MLIYDLFELFLRDRKYLKNSSDLTIKSYRQSWGRFSKAMGSDKQLSNLNKPFLDEFVIKLRETGIAVTTCNITIREINSFITWLHENEYIEKHLKMKQLKVEHKVMKDFSDDQIKRILNWKPKGFYQWRLYALLCLIIDTGIRVNEALTLQTDKVDLDQLLITVYGKGHKERVVPISLELRKILWRYKRFQNQDLFFCTKKGGRLSYHNMLREFKHLAKSLQITGVRISFHTLRYGFALNYIRQGGSTFHLMRAMGHTTIAMTEKYVRLVNDDLQKTHVKTSMLNRLK